MQIGQQKHPFFDSILSFGSYVYRRCIMYGSSGIEAKLAFTIARTGGDAGDIIVTTYGVHYEKDTPGSRTETTK